MGRKVTVIGTTKVGIGETEFDIDDKDYRKSEPKKLSIAGLEDYLENLDDFIVISPEYSFCPLLSRTYPVILTDWNLNSYIYLQQIRKFSVIFVDSVGYLGLRRISSKFVELPLFGIIADCKRFREVSQLEKKIDVVFLGNLNPGIHTRRNHILRKILLLPERYKIVIGGGLYDENLYPLVLASSKIVFNFSVRKEMNMRTFEALNSRSLLFLEDENVETWKYIRKWSEAIPYRSENVEELLIRYIGDDVARETVASAGFERIEAVQGAKLWNKILDTLSYAKAERIDREDPHLRVSSLRSLINLFFNCPQEFTEGNINYIENLGVEIAISVSEDKILKSSVFNDLSFLFFSSAFKAENVELRRKYVQNAIRYMNSALALNPKFSIYWYNLAYLLYSAGDNKGFLTASQQFLKSPLPREIDGFPNFFCPIIFSHYDYIKSYIDYVWIEHISDIERIRLEISKALISRIFVLLSNFSLENGDLKQAEDFAMEALKNFPEISDIYFLLGRIKFQKNEYKDSAKFYLKGYELNIFDFTKWGEIAMALALANMQDELKSFLNEIRFISKRIYFHNGGEFTMGNTKVRIKPVFEIFQDFGISIR